MGYTLITGATGGLGRAFVDAVAAMGEDMILTGRSEEKLRLLQAEIAQKYPDLKTHVVAADLSKEGDRDALKAEIVQKNLLLKRLINVAGADVQKALQAYTPDKIRFQCRVNLEAAIDLSHFALTQREEGLEILNVSSVSGIYPMPYFAIYSATKGALTSFSVALREEVKREGVKVTVALPGAMPTREDIKEQIKGQGVWGKIAAKSPQYVANVCLKAVAKNRAKVIVGFANKCMRFFTAWIPASWRMRFIANRWSRISKDAF